MIEVQPRSSYAVFARGCPASIRERAYYCCSFTASGHGHGRCSQRGATTDGSCGYGSLNPSGAIGAVASDNPVVAGLPQSGCGACVSITCDTTATVRLARLAVPPPGAAGTPPLDQKQPGRARRMTPRVADRLRDCSGADAVQAGRQAGHRDHHRLVPWLLVQHPGAALRDAGGPRRRRPARGVSAGASPAQRLCASARRARAPAHPPPSRAPAPERLSQACMHGAPARSRGCAPPSPAP